MKKWKINKCDETLAEEFASKCDINKLALKVLTSRGVTDFQQVIDFFDPPELSDPFLIKDMDKAVEIINEKIDSYELICIYGDYDCDGITSTSLLYNYLENMGANVMYYIPERSEGYGLNAQAIEQIAQEGASLIITVDNGISAVEEAKLIKELGMQLVITDHHQVPEVLPEAVAVIDPHRSDCPSPYKDLCGVGVAFKLCAALDDGNYDAVLEQYVDICAIGTVADVVPLNGENRTIVKHGLEYLKNTENPALCKLFELSSLEREQLNAENISFRIAPVINASGRFDTPLTAVKALLSEDPDEAEGYISKLFEHNTKRKQTESEIIAEIIEHINKYPQTLNHSALVLWGKNWHAGVIGIVSAKILDLYGKPNFIISIDDDGNARGSARSVHGFDVFECLCRCAELCEKFGGHECAGGFSLKEENIGAFCSRIYDYADSFEKAPVKEIEADMVLMPGDITVENVKGLKALEPFGQCNSVPTFAILGAKVLVITPLSQGKHTRIDFNYGGFKGQALFFSLAADKCCFKVGDKLDMIVKLDINVFRGAESVSIVVKDYRISGIRQERYFAAKQSYEKLMRGEKLPSAYIQKMIPSRDELIKVYKYINSVKATTADHIFMNLNDDSMNYCKLRICIDIFKDKGLVEYSCATGKVNACEVKSRVDLEQSQTLVKLKQML